VFERMNYYLCGIEKIKKRNNDEGL
jgi:hypothetical protein